MSCSSAPLVADPWSSAATRAAGAARPVSRSGDDDGDGLLTAIATGLASVALPWELATGEQPAERQFQLLIATDVYDAWLVHWPVGTGLDLHDHGGSAGAFAVVAGDLDEDVVRDGTTVTTRVGPGASVVFGQGHVHAVVNRSSRRRDQRPRLLAATDFHGLLPARGRRRARGPAGGVCRPDEPLSGGLFTSDQTPLDPR